MRSCNCSTIETSRSGGNPFEMFDFSDDYTVHFRYANWDCYFVFTCNVCGTIWYTASDFVDRPPYIAGAKVISQKEIDNLNSWTSEEISHMIESKGIRVMDKIINGTARAEYYGQDAPKDSD